MPFVILDAAGRGGDAWRGRWDSLELFTTARYSALPGLAFPGDPEHFPGKDEVAGYLERYARVFALPVRHGARAGSLERRDGGYRLETSAGPWEAGQVIVATGAYQQPRVPPFAGGLSREVAQVHSAAYRNPAQIPGHTVLVVGASNSGAQIAADLAATHRVFLSRGTPIRRLPRRILGKSLHWWGDHLGLIPAPYDTWRGRTQRAELLVGDSLRQLARAHGIQLVGRAIGADSGIVRFAGGLDLAVDAVVWATGYRPDYTWIHVPVLDERGLPRHQRGVTASPGLYFLGMHGQYSRGSSLIHWVRYDARFIAAQARAAAASPPLPGGTPGSGAIAAFAPAR